jgi:hypothetical protein
MGRLNNKSLWILKILTAGGAIVALMAQVPFETAQSNLATYARAFRLDAFAAALPDTIDRWATFAGLSIFILAGLALLFAKSGTKPTQRPTSSPPSVSPPLFRYRWWYWLCAHPPFAKWAGDKFNAIDSSRSIQNRNARIREAILTGSWTLNFNPAHPNGHKPISFLSDGSIGIGKNRNEFRWELLDDILRVFREDGALQNDFRYIDPQEKFICTNNNFAKGYKDQYIARTDAVPGSTKEAARTRLAQLRTEGVQLRNEGQSAIFDDTQWAAWQTSLTHWRNEVRATIEKISLADAEMWFTLNKIPAPDIPMDSIFASDEIKHQYAMHDFRIQKLEALLDRYSKS